jgi:hypothetical protein
VRDGRQPGRTVCPEEAEVFRQVGLAPRVEPVDSLGEEGTSLGGCLELIDRGGVAEKLGPWPLWRRAFLNKPGREMLYDTKCRFVCGFVAADQQERIANLRSRRDKRSLYRPRRLFAQIVSVDDHGCQPHQRRGEQGCCAPLPRLSGAGAARMSETRGPSATSVMKPHPGRGYGFWSTLYS